MSEGEGKGQEREVEIVERQIVGSGEAGNRREGEETKRPYHQPATTGLAGTEGIRT